MTLFAEVYIFFTLRQLKHALKINVIDLLRLYHNNNMNHVFYKHLKFFSKVQLIIKFLYSVLSSSTVRGTKATTFLSKSPHKVLLCLLGLGPFNKNYSNFFHKVIFRIIYIEGVCSFKSIQQHLLMASRETLIG